MTEDETRPPASPATVETRRRPRLVRRLFRPTGSWFTRRLKPIWSWSKRKRDDLILDGLIAVVVLTVAFVLDARISDRQDELSRDLATSSEVQENTRFVRQVAVIDKADVRPFTGLNLQGASLAGVDLDCEARADPMEVANDGLMGRAPEGCTNLTGADLTGADLYGADLTGAYLNDADLTGAYLFGAYLFDAQLIGTDLTGADLTFAFLTGANLHGANLTGANLTYADLTGAYLVGADLTDADLTEIIWGSVCYSEFTTWPDAYTPPSPTTCD